MLLESFLSFIVGFLSVAVINSVGSSVGSSSDVVISNLNLQSFSGLINVRSFPDGWNNDQKVPNTANSAQTFYWFFPPQNKNKTSPLIIWLQGGPGSSSMIGLFHEMGPLKFNPDKKIILNQNSWNDKYAMLFIDNPVGTGYSFVDSNKGKLNNNVDEMIFDDKKFNEKVLKDLLGSRQISFDSKLKNDQAILDEVPEYADGYTKNQAAVSRDLFIFLERFYNLYPLERQRDLYIAGESYAGKYVPSFASYIHKQNKLANIANIIPLKGVLIGNALVDPITQIMSHHTHALTNGLISNSQSKIMEQLALSSIFWLKKNDFLKSLSYRNNLFAYFTNVTNNVNVYDLRKFGSNDWSFMESIFNTPRFKKMVHVPNEIPFIKDPLVAKHLATDIMKSTKLLIPYLLDTAKIKVLIYHGLHDFKDGPYGASEYIEGMHWSGAKGFSVAERSSVRDGWKREFGRLSWVVLNGCGHLVPQDNPVAAKEMAVDFIH